MGYGTGRLGVGDGFASSGPLDCGVGVGALGTGADGALSDGVPEGVDVDSLGVGDGSKVSCSPDGGVGVASGPSVSWFSTISELSDVFEAGGGKDVSPFPPQAANKISRSSVKKIALNRFTSLTSFSGFRN